MAKPFHQTWSLAVNQSLPPSTFRHLSIKIIHALLIDSPNTILRTLQQWCLVTQINKPAKFIRFLRITTSQFSDPSQQILHSPQRHLIFPDIKNLNRADLLADYHSNNKIPFELSIRKLDFEIFELILKKSNHPKIKQLESLPPEQQPWTHHNNKPKLPFPS
jgi:hypothetical protein